MGKDSFASLMEASKASDPRGEKQRLRARQELEGVVLQLGSDLVFVNVGAPSDGRIPASEVTDENGICRLRVGEKLRVMVVDPRPDGPLLKPLLAPPPAADAPAGDE